MQFHAIARWCWWLLPSVFLGGCATTTTPLTESIAMVFSPGHGAAAIPDVPDPRYVFLRVQATGYPPGMLALGYVDAHPEGPVLVWYSANGQVLRTQNGHIVGSTGAPVEWSALRWITAPPPWNTLDAGAYHYVRERDVQPGYQFGIREEVHGEAVPPPAAGQLPATLPLDMARQYRWYREVVTASPQPQALPPALFAWGQYAGEWTVVYSEQCLSSAVCVQMQRWPVRKEVAQ